VCSTVLYRRAVYANFIRWWNKLYNKDDYQAFEWPKITGPGGPPQPEIPRI
jgi:hypothetical protein